MKLVLKIIGPNGEVTELPVDEARLEITTIPGHSYQLVAADGSVQPLPLPTTTAPGKADAPVVEVESPRAQRINDDLLLDQLPEGYPILLSGFFANCEDRSSCEVIIDIPGAVAATLTPASEPLAAYAEGGFLMYSGSPLAAATLPTPPEAEPATNWRPMAALGGGLAVALAAGGGGGGAVASDSTPPATPTIDSGAASSGPNPVFSGTADPGSTIRLSLQIASDTVGYTTVAGNDGTWTVNTLTDAPTAGQFPAAGLQAGQNAAVTIVASDDAGNISAVVSENVVLDTVAPPRPVINAEGDLSRSASADLEGVAVIDAAETADGLVIDGTAEAGSTVTMTLTGPGGYSLTDSVVTDETGKFSLPIAASSEPADGEYTLNLIATDPAGNDSVALQTAVFVDTTLSEATVAITAINDDRTPGIGEVTGATNDTTPVITGSLVGRLASDEEIQVLRDGDLVGTAELTGANWSITDNLNAVDGGPEGDFAYTAQVADNAGNAGNAGNIDQQSAPVAITVDTTPPAQIASIVAITDDTGRAPVVIRPNGTTVDTTPTIQISLSDVLAPGESLQLVRSFRGDLTVVDQAVDPTGSADLSFEFEDTVPGNGNITYQAQIVDAAGLGSTPSATYTIRILDPIDNLP